MATISLITPTYVPVCKNTVKCSLKKTKPKTTQSFIKEDFNKFITKAEKVNGRCAMIGFSSAVIDEVVNHQPISEQFMDNIGLAACVMSLIIVGTASNPKDTGVSPWGIFEPEAEKWNGLAAMIGIISLLITETTKNPPVALF